MKNKTNKVILIVVIVAIWGVVTYYLYKKNKEKNTTPTNSNFGSSGTDTNINTNTNTSGTSSKWQPEKFPLQKGMQGTKVSQLQKALNIKHQAGLVEDGKFGDKTYGALIKFGYGYPVTDILYVNITRTTGGASTKF